MPTTLDAPIARTLETHPQVMQALQVHGSHKAQAQAARERLARLTAERASLVGDAVTALVSLGKTNARDVKARTADLDAQIAEASADVKALEADMQRAEVALRRASEQAQQDIEAAALAEAREIVGQMLAALRTFRAAAQQLDEVRPRVAGLPNAQAILLGFGDKFEAQARQFGVSVG